MAVPVSTDELFRPPPYQSWEQSILYNYMFVYVCPDLHTKNTNITGYSCVLPVIMGSNIKKFLSSFLFVITCDLGLYRSS